MPTQRALIGFCLDLTDPKSPLVEIGEVLIEGEDISLRWTPPADLYERIGILGRALLESMPAELISSIRSSGLAGTARALRYSNVVIIPADSPA